MTDPTRLPIGEFSRITWLSPKALRLYERRRLLMPDLVDEHTGYRSYLRIQAGRARAIALLRRAGMSLDQVGAVLDAPVDERHALLERFRLETSRAHERAMALLGGLANELPGAQPDDAAVPQLRETRASAYVSRIVRTTAADLPARIEQTVAALLDRAGPAVDRTQPLAVLYQGEVSWESDGPIEVRVPVDASCPADGVEPSGHEIFLDVPIGSVQFPTILSAFDAVRGAATQGGRQAQGPPRELYSNGAPFTCQVAQRVTMPLEQPSDGGATESDRAAHGRTSDAEPRVDDGTWEDRVAAFWSAADDERPADMWASLEPLLAERPDGDAAASFERASLHDMLGEEHAAIPHYRAAIAGGLDAERQGYAAIQLASTLRNVGQLEEAATLLEPLRADARLGPAARAFLALTLHDLGYPGEALRIVLSDHAPNVPLYGRALGEYAELLPSDLTARAR